MQKYDEKLLQSTLPRAALRNIGFIQSSAATLHRCYEEATNPMEIRLAAIDTVKKLVCQSGEASQKESLARVRKQQMLSSTKISRLHSRAHSMCRFLPTKMKIRS